MSGPGLESCAAAGQMPGPRPAGPRPDNTTPSSAIPPAVRAAPTVGLFGGGLVTDTGSGPETPRSPHIAAARTGLEPDCWPRSI